MLGVQRTLDQLTILNFLVSSMTQLHAKIDGGLSVPLADTSAVTPAQKKLAPNAFDRLWSGRATSAGGTKQTQVTLVDALAALYDKKMLVHMGPLRDLKSVTPEVDTPKYQDAMDLVNCLLSPEVRLKLTKNATHEARDVAHGICAKVQLQAIEAKSFLRAFSKRAVGLMLVSQVQETQSTG
jgi:hypothetical protein